MSGCSGLLVETAQKYHARYIADIAFKIGKNKHLSVLIPSLMGMFPVIPNIYDILEYKSRMFFRLKRRRKNV